jgi:saccharopine dehydrogenase-like NADP-dependent oxidoreductase
MNKNVVVLGCGLIGNAMARDLAIDGHFAVTAVDVRQDNLDRLRNVAAMKTAAIDLSDPAKIKAVIADADVVVGAMPSALGFSTLRTVIECGKPFADISFMVEDAMQLDDLAKRHGACVVFDCGVAPGLANVAIGHCHAALDRTDRVVYYVGGLPKNPQWPWRYKAPFAPADVLEEYTRPVRMIENGKPITRPALSEPERITFEPVGELEAFNTDGLRSLIRTIAAPNMVEKTLRHPGHADLMAVLRESGFFSKDALQVGGATIRPLDVTSRLLFPMWAYEEGEEEFTILRVIVEGRKGGRGIRYQYDLYDEYDRQNRRTSMARTTGFPCAIVARMLARGEIAEPGVHPPEYLGAQPGLLDTLMKELAARGVRLNGGIR